MYIYMLVASVSYMHIVWTNMERWRRE